MASPSESVRGSTNQGIRSQAPEHSEDTVTDEGPGLRSSHV
jgi:hypothetical protein